MPHDTATTGGLSNGDAGLTASVGARIRAERLQRRMTLRQLADATGVSVSFLSQVERNRAKPSVATLHVIAEAFDISMAELFAVLDRDDHGGSDHRHPNGAHGTGETATRARRRMPPRPGGPKAQVVRAGERPTLTYPGSGIRNELLTPDLQRAIQFMWVVIPPHASTGSDGLVHEGEECGVVIQGQVEIWVDDDEHYLLGPGDAIYQSSTVPHRSRNPGDIDTIIVTAITPPSL